MGVAGKGRGGRDGRAFGTFTIKMDSDREVCSGSSTRGSDGVEDVSPPESPGLNGDTVDSCAGPMPYLPKRFRYKLYSSEIVPDNKKKTLP